MNNLDALLESSRITALNHAKPETGLDLDGAIADVCEWFRIFLGQRCQTIKDVAISAGDEALISVRAKADDCKILWELQSAVWDVMQRLSFSCGTTVLGWGLEGGDVARCVMTTEVDDLFFSVDVRIEGVANLVPAEV